MPVSIQFKDFVMDQLDPALDAEARRMFGGYGLYSGDLFWGILHNDTLWLRADGDLAQALRDRGGVPFAPFKKSKKTLRYLSVAADLLEDRNELNDLVARSISARTRKPA